MLKPPETLHSLTPIQIRYYNDMRRFLLVSAGRRSRKTLIGRRKLLNRALPTTKQRFFHAAPTLSQARAIFWSKLKADTAIFRRTKNSLVSESYLMVRLDSLTEIHVVGLDKPERIEGQPWHGCHITEFADVKPKAWGENIRPVLADTKGFAILDGVPDITKIAHKKMARKVCGGIIPPTVPLLGAYATSPNMPQWAYYSWFSSDVLPTEEIAELEAVTDPSTFRQEYQGSYESLTGLPYYAFTNKNAPEGHIDNSIKYNPTLPVLAGFDFNVDPMTAVLGHVVTEGKQQVLKLFKGYFIRNSNTKTLCRNILNDFPDTKVFFITPCQSATARQTSQDIGVTDLRIIKDAFSQRGKHLRICKRTKNPRIIDRINATNAMFHHNRLRINSTDPGLRRLITDFEEVSWRPGTSDLDIIGDEYRRMLGHITAALDYMVEYHWPIKRKHVDSDTNFNNFVF